VNRLARAAALLSIALAATPRTALAQTQVLDGSDPVAIASTTPIVIDTVTVASAGTRDVVLVAHLYAEATNLNGGGYEFRLERVSPAPTATVGTADWTPAAALTASPIGDTVAITGFDLDVEGPAAYRLVGQKIDAGAASLTVTARGIDAIDRTAGSIVSAARAAGSVPIGTTATSLVDVDLDAVLGSDFLLFGHVTLSKSAGADGTYLGAVCEEGSSGLISSGWAVSVETPETNVLPVLAFVPNLASDTTVSSCIARASDAPSATATFRSFAAVRSFNAIVASTSTQQILLPSTSRTLLWILDVPDPDPDGMAIFANATLAVVGPAHHLYELTLHRGSCAGAQVGATGFRPGAGAVSDQDVDSVLLTGFDPSPTGVESYALCGRKTNVAAPDLAALFLTMAALPLPVPEPSPAAALLVGAASVASLARRRGHARWPC